MQVVGAPRRAQIANEAVGQDSLRIAFVAATALITTLALFLASRRVTGAMSAPLAAGPLFATAIVLLLTIWCGRLLARDKTADVAAHPAARFTHWLAWTTFAALLLVAFACSFPFTRFVDWLVWLPTIAAAWFGPRALDLRFSQVQPSPSLRLHATTQFIESEPSERILQQLTRFRTVDGADAIRGTLTAEFTTGQRAATLYVGFCPPFERHPEIDTEVDESDFTAEVSVIQLQHNGAQLEVRLPGPADSATQVTVAFFAAQTPADEA